jgi:hypothetical protein
MMPLLATHRDAETGDPIRAEDWGDYWILEDIHGHGWMVAKCEANFLEALPQPTFCERST